jgi:hypothetical protein
MIAQYRRTDLQYNPDSLQFFPPHVTAYDSVHDRFFISNATLNRIDVFDATQESQVCSIIVPEPWGMDVASDGSSAISPKTQFFSGVGFPFRLVHSCAKPMRAKLLEILWFSIHCQCKRCRLRQAARRPMYCERVRARRCTGSLSLLCA